MANKSVEIIFPSGRIMRKTFSNIDQLKKHILTHPPTLYYSSQTSTVIPFERIETYLKKHYPNKNLDLCDLSGLPKKITLLDDGNLKIQGAVCWQEVKEFLKGKKRRIMTSPTEELAAVIGGVATSATGERCFAYNNLRGQIVNLKYLNNQAQEIELSCEDNFSSLLQKNDLSALAKYQTDFDKYQNFKNAPFPRFSKATDLLIGTEGQLGVITETTIKTVADGPISYFFILLPKWEENLKAHLEIIKKVQSFREDILAVEFIDSNSVNFLKEEDQLGNNQDVIFLEILGDKLEKVCDELLFKLEEVNEDKIFEIDSKRYYHIRASVPREIFESNQKEGVTKVGTDIQVKTELFEDLMLEYRKATKLGVDYNIFGHIGDAHLHFNYMPKSDSLKKCQERFVSLYNKVIDWNGSPFAEHGIGLLKQKYIQLFYFNNQHTLFNILKDQFDPHNQFFPLGFMSINRM